MVKHILKLFFVYSLILQAQSAKSKHDDTHESISTTPKELNSKVPINHKIFSDPFSSPTAKVPTNSYIIKPLSTVYSSLPSDLYTSHTFAPKSKHKRALSETPVAPKTTSSPLSSFSEIAKPINENTSSLASAEIDSSTKTVVEIGRSSSESIDRKLAKPFEVSSTPGSAIVVEKSLPTPSIPRIFNNIEHYTIPKDLPALNNEILRGMPSKSFTLKKPTLPSHSNDRIQENKHNYISSTFPRPSHSASHSASNHPHSSAPLHAAQIKSESSLFSSIIPSILKQPQQIQQQISSSLNGKTESTLDFAAQSVSSDTRTSAVSHSQTTMKVIPKETPNPEAHISPCYRRGRKVEFSQYWIPKENEWDETNGGRRVFLGGDAKMKLYDRFDKEIGMVPVDMYQKCRMEGTCLLENGDLINIESNDTDTFIKIGGPGRKENVFGLGSGPQNLVPFVSVAANDIPYGQKLYISALDGVDLGNGMTHNGCVRVDDDSWSFDSCQIDFFVVTYVDYLWLDLDTKVSIKYADCKLKNYVTPHHLSFVKASTDRAIIPHLLHAKSSFPGKNLI